MKKTLLALAVVAGFAQANETTLYGRLWGEAQVNKKVDNKATVDIKPQARVGVKGNEDLSAGLKAIYQMEFNYNFTNTNDDKVRSNGALNEVRQAYVGLTGDFGTLKLGKQTTVHAAFTNKADFSNTFGGSLDNEGTTRLAKAVSYATPDMGGVTLAAALEFDGSQKELIATGADSKNLTAFEVGGQYAANGLEVAATYGQVDAPAGVSAFKYYSASVGYGADNFGVAFDFESNNYNKDKYYAIGGEYKFTEQDRVYLGVEALDPRVGKTEYFGHLGYQHNLSKRTRAWVEVAGKRESLKDTLKTKGGYQAAVGLRHDF